MCRTKTDQILEETWDSVASLDSIWRTIWPEMSTLQTQTILSWLMPSVEDSKFYIFVLLLLLLISIATNPKNFHRFQDRAYHTKVLLTR